MTEDHMKRQKHPSWNQGEASTRVSHLNHAVACET